MTAVLSERITTETISIPKQALPVDGVYLDLHGAMVVETYDDGEGELLRARPRGGGPRVPIVASLDLHANVTRAMFERADALVAYRTYPHVDMAETGARAARLLDRMLKRRGAAERALLPARLPDGHSVAVLVHRALQGVSTRLARLEEKTGAVLSFTPGFPMADFADCGMAVFGYGARKRCNVCAARRRRGKGFRHGAARCPRRGAAARNRGEPGAPVVLADTQDNPGAGGGGDTAGLLKELVSNRRRMRSSAC